MCMHCRLRHPGLRVSQTGTRHPRLEDPKGTDSPNARQRGQNTSMLHPSAFFQEAASLGLGV